MEHSSLRHCIYTIFCAGLVEISLWHMMDQYKKPQTALKVLKTKSFRFGMKSFVFALFCRLTAAFLRLSLRRHRSFFILTFFVSCFLYPAAMKFLKLSNTQEKEEETLNG